MRGLQALLGDAIDYAGLFPPAALELDPAIRNFARYQAGPENWILGRFVCPAARLRDLLAFRALFTAERPLRLSVLGRGGADPATLLSGIEQDFRDVADFMTRLEAAARFEAFEVRVPAYADEKTAADSLGAIGERLAHAGFGPVQLFAEATLGPDWQTPIGTLIGGLAEHNRRYVRRIAESLRPMPATPFAGFKLRTGGLEPASFPGCDQVAHVIHECATVHVPLKFTAGLHHPLRHFAPSVRTFMHGFLNVFVAGVLAGRPGFGPADVQGVIEEQDLRDFAFDDGVSWNEARVTLDDIAYARQNRVISFGSCSVDEPLDDLRRMNLL